MTTDEYDEFVKSKINTPIECSYLGLAGETGEYLDAVKKEMFHGHIKDSWHEVEELGDILFYLTDIARRRLGCTLQAIMHANVDKLNRRYKGAFTKEESVNRAK